jgi:hypothetical protein
VRDWYVYTYETTMYKRGFSGGTLEKAKGA